MPDYTIKITGRGEAIIYEAGNKIYAFEVSFSSVPCKLYTESYSRVDLGFRQFKVSEDEDQIIQRILDWISSRDKMPVQRANHPPVPLRSVEEILQEKLNSRYFPSK